MMVLKTNIDVIISFLRRFVEAYEAAGADMWGLTTQNEPLSGFDEVSLNWI